VGRDPGADQFAPAWAAWCQDEVVAGSQGAEPGLAVTAGFAERLLELIDSGRRTATYKLALLMALLDLCARRGDEAGYPPPRAVYQGDR
jgi:hypothetical protein